ncbi:unnamed protein product [Blepharisma stoltei]|uniref:Uncharacterized protein n=1 Tax=Blepharisma stoltei TaxID=1481888 RepID=A0AAU9IDN3_9CILI|nr:unnamed protein product [Blepharisma stoltei]
MNKINKLLNRSERDYNEYLAQKILKDINIWKTLDSIKNSYLNKLDLVDFPDILSCFNSFIRESNKEDLVKLILLSRTSKEIDLACSNAATILAKSDFVFKDIDFSRIRIPKADLSQRLFVNATFENSYLKEVKFLQSQFHCVNFKNCDLSCANFGYFIKFNSKDAKGLNFSTDDKYFYYQNDDSVIEIDLKEQKIRNKVNLNDFITTNITYTHSFRFESSLASVHGQYIKIKDNYGNRLICELNLHRLVISSNWKYIAALDANSTVLSWDIEKGKQILGITKALTYRTSKLVFSPSNRYLAMIRAGSISVIETENWSLYRKFWGKFPIKNVFSISYCGQKMAFCDSESIYIIDTITSAKTKIFYRTGKILCLSFSPCGKFLAINPKGNEGFIIDLKTKNISQFFSGFEGNIISVMFSISGKYISWSDSKGSIKIYEFSSKFVQNDNNRHLTIYKAKVSPKGTYLITTSLEKSILWELRTCNPKQIKKFMQNGWYNDYVFSPFETYLLRKFGDKIQIYDIKRDFSIKTLSFEQWWNLEYSFSRCENYLICLDKLSYKYYSIPDFTLVRIIKTQQNGSHLRFSECGNYDFWYDSQNFLYVWDLQKGDCMKKMHMESFICSIRALSPFLLHIAFFTSRENVNYIDILNVDDGDIVSLKSEGKSFSCCIADSDGALLIEGCKKGIFNLWDIKTKTVKQKFRSLFSRDINAVEVANNHIIIKEKDNVEIFSMAQLG